MLPKQLNCIATRCVGLMSNLEYLADKYYNCEVVLQAVT